MKLRVYAPATSANIGPGFDCFGIAWDCYNQTDWSLKGTELQIDGCDPYYQNENNLAYVAYCETLYAVGVEIKPVHLHFGRTDIPVCRGMGSSAALTVSGILAADKLYGLGLSGEKMLEIAASLEGHPDNAAPALQGGFTMATADAGRVFTAKGSVHERWRFAAVIPDFELPTAQSRGVLPKQVSRADAVFNITRAVMLEKALCSGDSDLLSIALRDKLHQPYRKALIPGFDTVQKMVEACGGVGMCLSGAGPTMLCVGTEGDFAQRLRAELQKTFPTWEVRTLTLSEKGAYCSL